jgi:hydrogenase-4 component B
VEAARDVGGGLLAPMLAIAAACVLLGVLAPFGVAPAIRAAGFVAGVPPSAYPAATALGMDARWIGGIALSIYAAIGLGWLGRRAMLRRRVVQEGETWACGYPMPTPRMQYTASSFAAPLLSAFGRLSGVEEHKTPERFETHPIDLVLDRVALPTWHFVQRAALRLRPMQQGRLSAYLVYVMVALVILLAYLSIGGR